MTDRMQHEFRPFTEYEIATIIEGAFVPDYEFRVQLLPWPIVPGDPPSRASSPTHSMRWSRWWDDAATVQRILDGGELFEARRARHAIGFIEEDGRL